MNATMSISAGQAQKIIPCISNDGTRGGIVPAVVLREILELPAEYGTRQVYASLPGAVKKGFECASDDPSHHTIALDVDVLEMIAKGKTPPAPGPKL